jgi:hypothetical protein
VNYTYYVGGLRKLIDFSPKKQYPIVYTACAFAIPRALIKMNQEKIANTSTNAAFNFDLS